MPQKARRVELAYCVRNEATNDEFCCWRAYVLSVQHRYEVAWMDGCSLQRISRENGGCISSFLSRVLTVSQYTLFLILNVNLSLHL